MAEAISNSHKRLDSAQKSDKTYEKMKGGLKIPSTPKRKVTLSDIIAATIGEETRAGDFVANVSDYNACDGITFPSFGDNLLGGNQTELTTQVVSTEASGNACDSSFVGYQGSNGQDLNQNPDLNNVLQDFGKSEYVPGGDCISSFAFDSQHDFWSTFSETNNLGTLQPLSGLSNDEGKPNLKQDTSTQSITVSADSDLEDSMHFVDPDDPELQEPANNLVEPENTKVEPAPKKRRFSLQDSTSCPFPIENLSQPEFFDVFVESCFQKPNNMPSKGHMRSPISRARSFSGPFKPTLSRQKGRNNLHDHVSKKTPTFGRARSFSEACNRDNLSPVGENQFNTSLTTLFESPESSPLAKNPFFNDLKSLLMSDCFSTDCPKALFDTLSHGHCQDVYARERNLQSKFSTLQNKYPDEVREMSSFYRQQSAEVETERLREIHDENIPMSYRNHLNKYYDNQLHMIMERVEKSLALLSSAKNQREVIKISQPFRTRPLLSRKAVKMMEEWYSRNYEHPYPGTTAVEALAKAGEISAEQVKKWFANKRNRCKNTKPTTEIANMKRKRQFSARW